MAGIVYNRLITVVYYKVLHRMLYRSNYIVFGTPYFPTLSGHDYGFSVVHAINRTPTSTTSPRKSDNRDIIDAAK